MPTSCDGQDTYAEKSLRASKVSKLKAKGLLGKKRPQGPSGPCDPNYCYIHDTGGKRCKEDKCCYSGQELPKKECKHRLNVRVAVVDLARAMAEAKAEGALRADEKATMRSLEAWLKKLRAEK